MIVLKNGESKQFVDLNGRRVNKRGYCVDREGNIVLKNGAKTVVFKYDEIEQSSSDGGNANGELPEPFFTMKRCDERKVRIEDESEHHKRMQLIAASKKKKVDLSEDNEIGSSVRGSIGKSNKSPPSHLYRGQRNI